jgi:flagellar biosynthesis/type III secretory pathway chaperone
MKMPGDFLSGRTRGLLLLLAGLASGLVLMWLSIKYEATHLGLRDLVQIMARKQELLSRMRANLLKSVEAEKSAVMADTDVSSRAFADESRQATEAVDRDRRELALLVEKDHTDQEMKLLREFEGCWTEFRKLDQSLLDLAVRNTNIKAANLSFGKGSLAMKRLEEALAGLKGIRTASGKENQIAELACNILTAGLKIHYLQAPHIAAASDARMDKIEASIHEYDEVIHTSLAKLKQLIPQEKQALLQEAEAAYDEFASVTAEVIDLSRQNTNIKSFELSLGSKRKVTAQCDEILMNLQEAVRGRESKATR